MKEKKKNHFDKKVETANETLKKHPFVEPSKEEQISDILFLQKELRDRLFVRPYNIHEIESAAVKLCDAAIDWEEKYKKLEEESMHERLDIISKRDGKILDLESELYWLKQENERLKGKVKGVLNHVRTQRKDYPGFGATEVLLKEILGFKENL